MTYIPLNSRIVFLPACVAPLLRPIPSALFIGIRPASSVSNLKPHRLAKFPILESRCVYFLCCLLLTCFPEIKEMIPDGPFSYPGQNPREVILVDPSCCPLLLDAKEQLLLQIESLTSEEDILTRTILFVREDLFDLMQCNEESVWKFIAEYFEKNKLLEIPLDAFLKEKVGVCRHIALVTTYLLDALIKEGKLTGEVLLVRQQTPFGRHAWTLFLTKHCAWHIDAYWELLENGKTDAGFVRLCKKYGKRVMEKEKLRWEDSEHNLF